MIQPRIEQKCGVTGLSVRPNRREYVFYLDGINTVALYETVLVLRYFDTKILIMKDKK